MPFSRTNIRKEDVKRSSGHPSNGSISHRRTSSHVPNSDGERSEAAGHVRGIRSSEDRGDRSMRFARNV